MFESDLNRTSNMEGLKTVNFTRLLSDDSDQSCLTEDYQTEIYYQLPSSIAARAQQGRPGDWEALEAPEGLALPGDGVLHGNINRETRDKASSQPLRELPLPIQGKREARDRRKLEMCRIGYWESWRRSQNIKNKRIWVNVRGTLSVLLPWRHILHTIESRFGMGVKAYFVFLRYLVYLNLVHSLLITGFILGPTAFYGRGSDSEPLRYGGDNDHVTDFFLGSGFVDRSPVFYRFYTPGSLNFPCLNTPLLFLVGIFTVFLISLIIGVHRTAVGYKHTWLLGKRYSVNVSYKIFFGWDFMIHDPVVADHKHSFIRNGLKLYLEEQRFHLREAQRTLCQKICLYFLRIILNLLVLSLLAGAFGLIYGATIKSNLQANDWFFSLLLQYLPPFVIMLINMVLPHIFRKISSFEDYSLTTQVNVTLVRCIFLKLASLGIYLFFLFKSEHKQCWENQFGREMYKLYTFNFLECICSWLINYFWTLLLEIYPSSRLSRLSGNKRFRIHFDVLDIVYDQTVTWVGVYYCPLLPLLGTVKLVVVFYIKKFTVLRCCVPEQRMFRGSSSLVLFHFMLMLGFTMAAATLGFKLLGSVPSSICGPFVGMGSVFNVTDVCVGSLPGPVQNTVHFLVSDVFAVTLILGQIVILTFYVSRRQANQRTIERLKNMLVMCSSDKHFLVTHHATMLRRKRKSRKAFSAGTEEGSCRTPGTPLHTSNEFQDLDLVSC